MAQKSHSILIIPALRARMGDWVYYISFMKMRDIAERISVVEDIHVTESLKDWLQRSLTSNARDIAKYLCTQEQRLFNAIVVGAYGGSPRWHEVSVRSRGAKLPKELEGALGFFELKGSETLFAIDGQHRVKGIEEALERKPALGEEEVCTIFVKGVAASERSKDEEGFERTRRLFATLNRYAKPVRKRDIIALDEDDVVAISTRRLLDEHELFMNKTAMRLTKPIPAADATSFTSLVTVYEVMDTCLRQGSPREWSEYKKLRPREEKVERFYQGAVRFWNSLCRHFPPLKEVKSSKPDDKVARAYRHNRGGHLLFRPVGLLLLARVVYALRQDDVSQGEAVKRISEAPMELSDPPWGGLLWDEANHRMLTAKENQRAARRLLYHGVGGDLSNEKVSTHDLRGELAGLLKKSPSQIKLMKYF